MHKVILLENANTEKEVFDVFAQELEFPDYFGRNMDAFWDVMTSLQWMDAGDLNIDIHGLTELTQRLDSKFVVLLLAQLGEICRYWDELNVAKDPINQNVHRITFQIFYGDKGSTKIGGNIWGDLGAGWTGPDIWKDDPSN